MKKTWKSPKLEILDVSMTMKHHGDAGGNNGGGSDDETGGEDVLGS